MQDLNQAKTLKSATMTRFFVTALAALISLNAYSQALNTLTAAEKKEGWKLLFDGKDLKGWHAYNGNAPGSAWLIEDGAIKLNVPERAGNKAKNGGDIVIDDVVNGDFEFKAEWKVSKYANSGIFFLYRNLQATKTCTTPGWNCR